MDYGVLMVINVESDAFSFNKEDISKLVFWVKVWLSPSPY